MAEEVAAASEIKGASMKGLRENLSLVVMCVFLIASLAFLAQQFAAYR